MSDEVNEANPNSRKVYPDPSLLHPAWRLHLAVADAELNAALARAKRVEAERDQWKADAEAAERRLARARIQLAEIATLATRGQEV